jgi:hypothetical protein
VSGGIWLDDHHANEVQRPSLMTSPGVRRMWEGGPLRQFSETQVNSHYIRYCSPFLTGFAGSYVCDRCRRPSAGVYLSHPSEMQNEWLCGGCRKQVGRRFRREEDCARGVRFPRSLNQDVTHQGRQPPNRDQRRAHKIINQLTTESTTYSETAGRRNRENHYSSRFLTVFAGSCVCDRCRRPSAGVYLSHPSKTGAEWLCGGCRQRTRTSGGRV